MRELILGKILFGKASLWYFYIVSKTVKNFFDEYTRKGLVELARLLHRVRPRSNVLNISLNSTEYLLSVKCSERLTTLLSLVHPC